MAGKRSIVNCEVCQVEFVTLSAYNHTRCIRHRKRQTDGTCQGCGCKLGPRARFCSDCAADREKARDRRKRQVNAAFAKQIVGCEGCGVDTLRGSRRHVHIFCGDCVNAQYEFWRRSAEDKGRFPFIRKVERFHEQKERAEQAKTRDNAVQHHAHVVVWRERQRIRQKSIEAAKEKPWLHPDLTRQERSRLHWELHGSKFENRIWNLNLQGYRKALKRCGYTTKAVPFGLHDVLPYTQEEFVERIRGMATAAAIPVEDVAIKRAMPISEFGSVCQESVVAFMALDNIQVVQSHMSEQYKSDKPWLDEPFGWKRNKARRKVDKDFDRKMQLYDRVAGRRRETGKELRKALRGKGQNNFPSLGFTLKELHHHIERQFTKGMTWDKFHAGEIHIDHRLPLASFDLTNKEEFKAAWSLTNLQPLWAEDNIKKHASRELLL